MVRLRYVAVLIVSTAAAAAASNACPSRAELRPRPQSCPLPGQIGIVPEIRSVVDWSHPPRCAESDGSVSCLFTSSAFRNGHGISLVASTTTTADLIGLGAFVDARDPPAAQKRKLLGPAYGVVDVPGKGKGVVARRRIKRGEILMVDVPAVLISTEFLAATKPHHRRRLMKQALAQLPEETKARMHALSRGAGKHEVDAIFGTNTNTVTLGQDEVHVGLFIEAARINHSCRPNAYFRFSPNRLTMEVVSYVAIEPGDEIVMSYTPLAMKHDARRKYLRGSWGFDCGCSLCRASDVEISDSEGRRRQMQDLRDTVSDARRNGYYKDAIAIARDWLDFSEWEDLPPLMPEYHGILADLYHLEGDLLNATTHARMALDGWVRFGSVDDSQLVHSSGFLREMSEKLGEMLEGT